MRKLKSQILKNSFWNFSSTLFNRVGSLIFTIILARILLPEDLGIYFLTISISVIFITLANTGVNSTLTRYVSHSIKSKKRAAAYFRYLFKIKSFFTFFIAFFLIFSANFISNGIFHKPGLFYPLLFSSIYLVFLSFESFFTSLFYAFKKVRIIFFKEILSNISKIIFLLIFSYFLSSSFYVIGAILSMSLAFLFSAIFMISLIKPDYSFICQKSEAKINKKKLLNFLFYISIGGISTIIFSYIDTFMLGIFVDDASFIGFYRVAFSLVFSIGGLLSLYNVLYPVFTQLKKQKIQPAFNKSIKYLSMIVIPSVFGLIVLSKYVIRLIYGYNYLIAAIPFAILCFLIMEMSIGNIFSTLLSAREKPQSFTRLILFAIFLNIILDYFAILFFKRYSLTFVLLGVAVATVISRFFYFIALYFILKKELKIKILFENLLKPILASFIFSAILLYLNIAIIEDFNLIIGIVEVICSIVLYMLSLLFLKGISIEEIKQLATLFAK